MATKTQAEQSAFVSNYYGSLCQVGCAKHARGLRARMHAKIGPSLVQTQVDVEGVYDSVCGIFNADEVPSTIATSDWVLTHKPQRATWAVATCNMGDATCNMGGCNSQRTAVGQHSVNNTLRRCRAVR